MKKVAGLRAKLTKSAVDKIAPPSTGKIIVWDADQAGFGVVVTAQGVKSWIINYRILSYAIEIGCITENPAFRFPRHSEQPRRRYLSLEEIARVMADINASPAQDSADVVRLLLFTGARVGEVLSMRWDNIDFERAVWSKPAAATKQKRDHHAPLTEDALALLRARRKATNGEWAFPARYSPTGHLTSIRVFWNQVCKRAKIADCHIHDLRHTFASLAARQGVPLQVVGGLLGHSDHKTTSRYLHLYDDPLRAGAEAVVGIIRGG